jgi:hypothetical protein
MVSLTLQPVWETGRRPQSHCRLSKEKVCILAAGNISGIQFTAINVIEQSAISLVTGNNKFHLIHRIEKMQSLPDWEWNTSLLFPFQVNEHSGCWTQHHMPGYGV